MSKRLKKVNDALQQELSDIIEKELKDPRVELVTITRVDVSPDLRQADVYISSAKANLGKALKALKYAKGFLKQKLSKKIRIKFMPDLNFKIDENVDEIFKIDKILKEIRSEDD